MASSLGRADPGWRLRNACAACCYRLVQEPKLKFSMLVAIDGNNSLKRVRSPGSKGGEAEGVTRKAAIDTRTIDGDYYLSRNDVDEWEGCRTAATGPHEVRSVFGLHCSC